MNRKPNGAPSSKQQRISCSAPSRRTSEKKATPPSDDDLSWRNDEVFKGNSCHRFVRSPDSRGWIWDGDLSDEKRQALDEREIRERMTREFCNAIARAFEPEPALTALVVGVASVMTESPVADDVRGRRRFLEEFIHRVDERIATLKNPDWPTPGYDVDGSDVELLQVSLHAGIRQFERHEFAFSVVYHRDRC